ncbi:CUB domain-containing protein [Caerostris extrusa]|uniref:CUB domain-containing protein n=1 Tax=Caerostris extrusa TaxID=172846 RepID=A0AAV4PE63_CAEEX|nr:CUB domain-containing protein [Caerostris extrusa]
MILKQQFHACSYLEKPESILKRENKQCSGTFVRNDPNTDPGFPLQRCECVVFDNTYSKEYGILHHLIGLYLTTTTLSACFTHSLAEDEMVEISFDEFDLQKTNLECVFGDFVKLFLHLDEPSVNEKTPYNSILCGKIMDIDQTHYSSGPALIFEFHTDWRRTNSTGFSGTYRFLSRKVHSYFLENTSEIVKEIS